MQVNQVSFKKAPKLTGLISVINVYSSLTHIYNNKIDVGSITQYAYDQFTVRLMVVDGKSNNPNCNWRWIRLTKVFKTEKEAREFIKTRWEEITRIHTLKTED